jgi:competence protein ComEC
MGLKKNTFFIAGFYILLIFGNFIVSRIFTDGRYIKFFSVGQADSAIINLEDKEILVDLGRDNTVLSKVGMELDYFDRKIDYGIVTHLDFDHVGGLFGLSKAYNIKHLVKPSFDSGREIDQLVAEESFYFLNAKEIDHIIVNNYILEFLSPKEWVDCDNPNACSVVFTLRADSQNGSSLGSLYSTDSKSPGLNNHDNYGLVLFTADAEVSTFEQIDSRKLGATVLKVPHHGSKNNLSQVILQQINPKVGVLSYGRNFYGHPAEELIDLLESEDVQIIDLYKQGDFLLELKAS